MMGNKRFQKHKGGGAKTGHDGGKHDAVAPIKTKSWPGVPGSTCKQPYKHDGKKMKDGLADKGL